MLRFVGLVSLSLLFMGLQAQSSVEKYEGHETMDVICGYDTVATKLITMYPGGRGVSSTYQNTTIQVNGGGDFIEVLTWGGPLHLLQRIPPPPSIPRHPVEHLVIDRETLQVKSGARPYSSCDVEEYLKHVLKVLDK